MKTIYIREKESHWSWDDKLAEATGRRMLARRMRARKQVNTILGACMVAAGLGKDPLEVLGKAERPTGGQKGKYAEAKMLCEL